MKGKWEKRIGRGLDSHDVRLLCLMRVMQRVGGVNIFVSRSIACKDETHTISMIKMSSVLPHVIVCPAALIRVRVMVVPALVRLAQVVLRIRDAVAPSIRAVVGVMRVTWVLIVCIIHSLMMPIVLRLSSGLFLLIRRPLVRLFGLLVLLLLGYISYLIPNTWGTTQLTC